MNNFIVDTEHPVIIPSAEIYLEGLLYIPKESRGLVLFAHGSGSNLHSVRNQYVADVLHKGKIATLLFNLLTPDEDAIDVTTMEFRFNIPFLASRLVDVTNWCLKNISVYHLPIGYFGASTGGGAAIVAAASKLDSVKAIVSRGGRPDLAKESLSLIKAPTLLIVGSNDEIVINLNQRAMAQMNCTKKLELIPGATHLFEEPGTLAEVAQLAKAWFIKYLVAE
ncbi:dienelactone hydrolase family protein [Legionella tunisiensis]|uniref:dienelactone hydrolase family protein n=1 Tax=Legionella tunisiensis TaxID=1034944 RepID=UPI0003711C0C|nr:dienelactone hydrolase family protein [Legionella tunisiensis]